MLVPIEELKKLVNIKDEDIASLDKIYPLMSQEVASYKDFCSVKGLVIGKIEQVEEHPDSNHLHITRVNVGSETLQIVCGAPNVEVGRKVIVALSGCVLPGGTIKNSTIRGVDSFGMNCALEELGIDHKFQGYDGIYYLDEDAPIGEDPISYLHLNDKVLELELTPNRCDLMSVAGVAYETKALLKGDLHMNFPTPTIVGNGEIKVSSETESCKRYTSLTIKGVKITESPAWLKGALMKMNIRPINNVVDITNYALMVTGQPLHAFDADKIATKQIVVKETKKDEEFTTLDSKERILDEGDIVITDGETPLCLGGVMGGLNSEVTDGTTNIFLEAALFAPKKIRATSRRLGLISESSLRFEKGIDPKMTSVSLNLAAYLMQELCGGKVYTSGSFDSYKENIHEVSVTFEKINSVIGKVFDKNEIISVFEGLGFDVKATEKDITVLVPERRDDIETYQDLIEEVIRIIGYAKIDSTIPTSNTPGGLSPFQTFKRKIRHLLSKEMNEVVTYSLTTKQKAVMFDESGEEPITIMNPLTEDRESMRHSSIPQLLEVCEYNINRKTQDLAIFELGRKYFVDKEPQVLGLALTGTISSTLWKGEKEKADFFCLKGIIEHLFETLSIKNYEIVAGCDHKEMHPYQSASIKVQGRDIIGFFGRVHPTLEKKYSLTPTYVAEIDLDKLFTFSHPLKSVKEISKFPVIERDLALVLDSDVSCQTLLQAIKKSSSRLLTNLEVFDLFKGESLGEGKKQIAVRLTFSDPKSTLETKVVDSEIEHILSELSKKDITLRA